VTAVTDYVVRDVYSALVLGCKRKYEFEFLGGTIMNRTLSIVLILVFCFAALCSGVDSQKTTYVGGTVSTIKEQTEGVSSTSDEKVFLFDYGKGKLEIPYDRIESLEYGQKVGRRGGIVSRWVITKKRKHFLTIGYKDENGQQQAAVLELGKDIVRVTLAALEARSGRKIAYQDEEARKDGSGN
jgi:hypothetical protein